MGRKTKYKKSSSGPGLLLLLIFLLIAAGVAVKIWGEAKKSQLSDNARDNIVVINGLGEMSLYSLDKTDQNASVVYLPGDLYVNVPGGYGQYRLKAVWGLGALDGKSGRLVSETVEDLIGVPIDGYLKIPDQKDLSGQDIRGLISWPLLLDLFHKNLSTNLSVIDLGKLIAVTTSLRFDKVKNVDLTKNSLLEDLLLADGSKVRTIDPDRLDYYLSGIFTDNNLVTDNLKIEVLNLGDISGLGSQVARLLTNIGLDVVNVANYSGGADTLTGNCLIKTDQSNLRLKTTLKIAEVFGCQVSTGQSQRADLTIIIRQLHPDE